MMLRDLIVAQVPGFLMPRFCNVAKNDIPKDNSVLRGMYYTLSFASEAASVLALGAMTNQLSDQNYFLTAFYASYYVGFRTLSFFVTLPEPRDDDDHGRNEIDFSPDDPDAGIDLDYYKKYPRNISIEQYLSV